jgi:hypothetical protein
MNTSQHLHVFSIGQIFLAASTDEFLSAQILKDFPKACRQSLPMKNEATVPCIGGMLTSLAHGQSAGGVARATKLSPERRAEIAAMGASARWKKRQASGLIKNL